MHTSRLCIQIGAYISNINNIHTYDIHTYMHTSRIRIHIRAYISNIMFIFEFARSNQRAVIQTYVKGTLGMWNRDINSRQTQKQTQTHTHAHAHENTLSLTKTLHDESMHHVAYECACVCVCCSVCCSVCHVAFECIASQIIEFFCY